MSSGVRHPTARAGAPRASGTSFVVGIVGTLATWALLTHPAHVSDLILPPPEAVLRATLAALSTADAWCDVGATVARVVSAVGLGLSVAVPAGLALGSAPRVYAAAAPPLDALRSVPASALFPLLLIVVGVGEASIVLLAFYPSVLVLLVNVVAGVRMANPKRVHLARSLGAGRLALMRDVLLYEALPSLLTGVRTAASYALVLVVAVEMFIGIGQHGLGRRIYDYQSTYRIAEAYGFIGIAGAVGVALNAAVSLVERRALRWHPSWRDEVTRA